MGSKAGKIIPNGMVLSKHEYATLTVLTDDGQDIELLKPSLTKYVKTGDFVMLGLAWEMKSPVGNSKSTMEHVFQKAAHQAPNIVIDLRRTKISDRSAIASLKKLFITSRSVRNLWIITKKTEIMKLGKNKKESCQNRGFGVI